jgi:hypothetical protein
MEQKQPLDYETKQRPNRDWLNVLMFIGMLPILPWFFGAPFMLLGLGGLGEKSGSFLLVATGYLVIYGLIAYPAVFLVSIAIASTLKRKNKPSASLFFGILPPAYLVVLVLLVVVLSR